MTSALALAWLLRKTLKNWEKKSGCLARAGLGTAENIITLEEGRDGFRLDGSRAVITGFGHSTTQGLDEIERIKRFHGKSPKQSAKHPAPNVRLLRLGHRTAPALYRWRQGLSMQER